MRGGRGGDHREGLRGLLRRAGARLGRLARADRRARQPRVAQGRKGAREPIERRGCELLFLPAYSPDFSPIEEAFSKLKALLRRAKARTREALIEAMGRALGALTPEDARGWFVHCGYAVAQSL